MVVSREFRGHDVFYRVRLEDGTTLSSQRPSTEHVPLGARVSLEAEPARVPVFRRRHLTQNARPLLRYALRIVRSPDRRNRAEDQSRRPCSWRRSLARLRRRRRRRAPNGQGGGELTVYSGREEEIVEPLFEDFEKQTGIKIKARYGDSAELAATIAEEGDNSPADVFFAQDPGSVGSVEQAGRLDSCPPPCSTACRSASAIPTSTGSARPAACASLRTTPTS